MKDGIGIMQKDVGGGVNEKLIKEEEKGKK